MNKPNIELLADAILRAAGSGLRHYSMHSTREAILKATEAAVQAGRDEVSGCPDAIYDLITEKVKS